MPAWLLALLNPLNWVKIASAIKVVATAVSTLLKQVQDYLRKREAEKRAKAVKQAVEEIKKADEVMDDEQRLKAKADALCKLEKLTDPSSDCDVGLSEKP